MLKPSLYIILLLMAITNGCKSNTPKCEAANLLNNELWTWGSSPNTAMGWSEAFFFSSNGRFKCVQAYSGGAYWVHWWSGKYEYNPENKTIILDIENGNTKNHDGTLVTKQCANSISIITTTDSTVIINRKPIGRWGNNDSTTTTFNREQNKPLLMIINGALDFDVASISIQKYSDDKVNEVNEHDRKIILDILNTATYNAARNDSGIMLKVTDPDYNIIVKNNNEQTLTLAIWETGQMKILLHPHWCNLDNAKLYKQLVKYTK